MVQSGQESTHGGGATDCRRVEMRFGSLFLQVQVCLLVTPVSHSHEWWQYAVLVTHVKSISPYHMHTRTDRSDSTVTTTEPEAKFWRV